MLGRLLPAGLLALSAAAAEAADSVPPGASACSGCHAPPRMESAVPSLSGLAAADIVEAMLAFRSGERPATVMDRIAKGFSEEEVRRIADWLAAEEEGP